MTRWRFFLLAIPALAHGSSTAATVWLKPPDVEKLEKISRGKPSLRLETPDGSLLLSCTFRKEKACKLSRKNIHSEQASERIPPLVNRITGFGGTEVVLYTSGDSCKKLRRKIHSFRSAEEVTLTSSNEKFFRVPRLEIRAEKTDCRWSANFNPATGER